MTQSAPALLNFLSGGDGKNGATTIKLAKRDAGRISRYFPRTHPLTPKQ